MQILYITINYERVLKYLHRRNTQHRTCIICGITKTPHWYRDSMSENDLCYKCYFKQYRTRRKQLKDNEQKNIFKKLIFI
uniref:GATA-type domain-containing protein n=1 Tax=Meloidogyne enterolobii TaxID=390850 RepID=A0A6V7XKB2_MELEN|nr:unnamed protein product [Meloidogyne enterolobii]